MHKTEERDSMGRSLRRKTRGKTWMQICRCDREASALDDRQPSDDTKQVKIKTNGNETRGKQSLFKAKKVRLTTNFSSEQQWEKGLNKPAKHLPGVSEWHSRNDSNEEPQGCGFAP